MRKFENPSEILNSTKMVERFLTYVQYDTQSDEEAESCPSTAKQLELAKHLLGELQELGLEASMDEHGYVLAELKGDADGVLGLIAHIDTAPAFSGTGVKPQLHENYDGSPIQLTGDVVIDPADSPDLLQCKGDTIITSDGTTLLGADDKSGIAAIMGALETLVANRDLAHPTIRVCFNPDEEIGRGAHKFPLEKFDAPVAFTVDGGFPCELNVETFSADKATVHFKGVAVHPGEAKGKMVNALTYMGKFLSRLPMAETPECTEEREGFFHPTDTTGDAAACKLNLILRDFDEELLRKRGERVRAIAEGLIAEEPNLQVEVEITQQYRNMHDELSKRPEIAERMQQAAVAAGLKPVMSPIRGGTDGSQLTAMGLPTPNIFAGGVNFHGPTEWVSTRAIALSTCVLLNLVQIYAGALKHA